jgi:RND family efflux transporter MFP subunit
MYTPSIKRVIFLFLIINSFSIYAIPQKDEAINVNVTKVNLMELYDSYEYVGNCRASLSRDFFATQPGTIDFIIPYSRSKVQINDVIMKINQNYAQSYKNATNLAYQNSLNLLEDAKKLYEKKFISQSELDSKKLDILNATKNLQIMQDQYDDLIIKAPFDGDVGAITYQVGDKVNVGDYLFSIVGSEDKKFIFQLPEFLFGKINDDSEIYISKNKQDTYVKAEITNISPYLIPKSNNFVVTAAIKQANYFPHNSIVRAKIILNKHKALAIPESSLLQNENGYFLFLVTSEKKQVKRIYVKTFSRLDNLIEIESAEIKGGDLILNKGLNKVLDGSLVNIIENK